ncbi:TIGR02679 family protein [Nocardia sp. NPDC004860]|uniref:TIGR02679 family protein n=1 Tax=Nocardia sp. NPDC004860 TaxID=3154557 RepID=UPI0033AB1620
MTLSRDLRAYFGDPSLTELWSRIRDRLERNGHSIEGTVRIELSDEAAQRVSGLLGRRLAPGRRSVPLSEMDAALLRSAAARGLVSVVAELTGSPLRDRPSERLAKQSAVSELWSGVGHSLERNGLADAAWAGPLVRWLHTSGLLIRGGERANHEFDTAVRALSAVLSSDPRPRMLAELAAALTGDAHALDSDRLAGRLALRGLSLALDFPEPATPRERIAAWERVAVSADTVSGTVLTWNLRPPGDDPWSTMMRSRAELGLVTHLTLAELASTAAPLAAMGITIAACENPQVLQRAAEIGVQQPLVCFSGNPSSAGMQLAERIPIRYHGDFDWPGISIAARLFAAGAQPWQMHATDYLRAVASGTQRLPLTGRPIATPWDARLHSAMLHFELAVHEESILDDLLTDLE